VLALCAIEYVAMDTANNNTERVKMRLIKKCLRMCKWVFATVVRWKRFVPGETMKNACL
jgi:hypothetical protein